MRDRICNKKSPTIKLLIYISDTYFLYNIDLGSSPSGTTKPKMLMRNILGFFIALRGRIRDKCISITAVDGQTITLSGGELHKEGKIKKGVGDRIGRWTRLHFRFTGYRAGSSRH